MINAKIISKIIGILLYIEAALLLLCALFPICYGEDDLYGFLYSVAVTVIAGTVLLFLGKGAEKHTSRKDGYVIVSMSWVIFSIFGMLPFYLSGYIPDITNAFFETMSGFTSTGATILDNIESLPHGLLFWRSMTQWIGGLGIVFFTIAVLPIFGAEGIQLFAAEATGPTHNKLHPRIGVTAQWIWSLYLGLTVAETILLCFGGMDLFDSICHSMTTTATGGYSTKQNSIAAYNSPYIEYIITLFMFLSGINFTLLFFTLLKGKIRKLFQDTEFRWYVGTVLFFTFFIVIVLMFTSPAGLEESFRKAIFQVVSIQTTTGFASTDYMNWTPVLWLLMSIVMCTYCHSRTNSKKPIQTHSPPKCRLADTYQPQCCPYRNAINPAGFYYCIHYCYFHWLAAHHADRGRLHGFLRSGRFKHRKYRTKLRSIRTGIFMEHPS